ncbi:MAG: hypothetical protein WAV73_02175 [Candidatus Moraniibacteriota bacterium]
MLDKISFASLLIEIIKFAIFAVVALVAGWQFSVHFFRKEHRLYKNLKRPIVIITPSDNTGEIRGKEMKMEIEKLKENNLFNVSEQMTDYKNFNPQNDHCLVILGYDKNMIGLDDVLNKIKMLQIPLIVYTYGENTNALDLDDKAKLDSYPWMIIANFKLTLINSIFNTLATYPYGKRKNK